MSNNRESDWNPFVPDLGERFRIITRLGAGGMGDVFRVHDRMKDKEVACKIMHEQIRNQRELARFSAEFRITSRLNHPNIIRVFDYGFTPDNRPFYTMELIDGDTLEQYAPGRSLEEIFSAIFEVCLALQRIHQAGLIHNDIKDRNIMITSGGRAIVMDLGLVCTGRTQTKHFKGTIGYAAPEMIRGDPYDYRSDLYALGVVIYHCLTGELPFDGDNVSAVIHAQLRGKITPLEAYRPDIPPEIASVVERLLALDPLKRFPSAADVIGALAECESTGLAERAAQLPPVYGLPQDFVGREDVLERLNAMLFSPRAGPIFPIVSLIGEKGIGKTRLAREFKINVQTKGARFLQIQIPDKVNTPYYAVRRIFRMLLAEEGDRGEKIIKAFRKHLVGLVPEHGKVSNNDAESERFQEADVRREVFLRGLTEAFMKLIENRPTALFIDDFHRIDKGTVRWLEKLKEYPGKNFVILIAVEEPEWEENWKKDELLGAFQASIPASAGIRLSPLSFDETTAYLAARFGDKNVSPEFGRRIFHETGGNPLFMEALIRELIELRFIRRDRFKWFIDVKELTDLPVARGVMDIFQRRIRALEPSQVNVLEIISIFPEPITLETFEKLAEMDTLEALDHLRHLVNKGFIAEDRLDGGLQYRYQQLQVRTIVYNRILRSRRIALHLKAASIIDRERKENYPMLAYHLEHGCDFMGAVRYNFRAGQHAESLFAFEDAIKLFKTALRLLAKLGNPREDNRVKWTLAVYSHLARCYQESGKPELSEHIVKKQLRFAVKYGAAADQIPILQNLGYLYVDSGHLSKARYYYNKAEKLFSAVETSRPYLVEAEAQLKMNAARVLMLMGHLEEAFKKFSEARSQAGTIGNSFLEALALENLACCARRMNLPFDAYRKESQRIAREHHFEDVIVFGNISAADVALENCRLESAFRSFDAAFKLADKLGSRRLKGLVRIYFIKPCILAGRFAMVDKLLSEIESMVRDGFYQGELFSIYHALGLMLAASGKKLEALVEISKAVRLAEEFGNRWAALNFVPDCIELMADANKLDAAQALWTKYHRMKVKYAFEQETPRFEFTKAYLAFVSGDLHLCAQRISRFREHNEEEKTLAGIRFDGLELQVRIEREPLGDSLVERWRELLEFCDETGMRYYSVLFRIDGIRRFMEKEAFVKSGVSGIVKKELDVAAALAEQCENPWLVRQVNTLRIQYGMKLGYPEIAYEARKTVSGAVEIKTVSALTETIRVVDETIDSSCIPAPADTWSQLSEADKELLASDEGGRYLLRLMEIFQLKSPDDD